MLSEVKRSEACSSPQRCLVIRCFVRHGGLSMTKGTTDKTDAGSHSPFPLTTNSPIRYNWMQYRSKGCSPFLIHPRFYQEDRGRTVRTTSPALGNGRRFRAGRRTALRPCLQRRAQDDGQARRRRRGRPGGPAVGIQGVRHGSGESRRSQPGSTGSRSTPR